MAQKRDDYEDEDSDDDEKLYFDKLTIFIGISFIVLSELFLYFLSIRTGSSYGLKEIAFALITGIVITLFLMWIRFIMSSNKYMGGFIGVAGVISVAYALTRKYQGTFTTIFLSIGILFALFYTIFYFIKSGKK
ncbi:MAG: hypothetical protein AABX23_01145 [Nanoarchaeota archaeon]